MHTGKHKTTQRNRILVRQGCVKSSLPGLLRLGGLYKGNRCIAATKKRLTTFSRTSCETNVFSNGLFDIANLRSKRLWLGLRQG